MFFQRGSKFYLYAVTVSINIISITSGIILAWPNPINEYLKSSSTEDNPIGRKISVLEENLLYCLTVIGFLIGLMTFAYTSDKIGRKNALVWTTVPMALYFITNGVGADISYFYFSKLMGGFASSAIFIIIPIFVGEIADEKNRGTLGCFMTLFFLAGVLYAHILSQFIGMMWFNLSCLFFIAIFLLIMYFFVPNSPYFQVAKSRTSQAEISLRIFRGRPSVVDVEKEMKVISEIVRESLRQKPDLKEIMKSKSLRKGFTICVFLIILQQFIGTVVLYKQTNFFFGKIAPFWTGSCSYIASISVIFVACIFAIILVDVIGRKPLLVLSLFFVILGLSLLGLFYYIRDLDYQAYQIDLLPFSGWILYLFGFGMGVGPLPYVLLSELFLPRFKTTAAALMSLMGIVSIILMWCANYFLEDLVKIEHAIIFFIICSIIGFVLVIVCVPETKGKNVRDIQIMLRT